MINKIKQINKIRRPARNSKRKSKQLSPTVITLLDKLTLEEECDLLTGTNKWEVPGCERLDIPEWAVSDGPSGVRGRELSKGLMLPAAIGMAATWDVDLLRSAAQAMAVEAKDRKVQVVLAPTLNLHRIPHSGRTFECYSEDPHLVAQMAVAFIDGLQSEGIAACAKHFVANEQETDRFTVSSEVAERTLREVYFVPFEAAVKQAGVRSVMGSYNLLNGVQCCANQYLLTDILRDEWGFDGFVVSDWSALHSVAEPLVAGVDLEMPGGGYWSSGRLAAMVRAGEIPESLIEERAGNLLRFLEWAGKLQGQTDHEEKLMERAEHISLARRVGAEGTVLVQNRLGVLPLVRDSVADGVAGRGAGDAGAKGSSARGAGAGDAPDSIALDSIALVGPCSLRPSATGGGAAQVGLRDSDDLPTALRKILGSGTVIEHVPGLSLDRSADPLPQRWLSNTPAHDPIRLELHLGRMLEGEPVLVQESKEVEVNLDASNWPQIARNTSTRNTIIKNTTTRGPAQGTPAKNTPTQDTPAQDTGDLSTWEYLSLRQHITITPDVSGLWRFCGAGSGEVRLFADGQLISDRNDGGFSVEPGFYSGEGTLMLEAGKAVELVLEHTSQHQHQRHLHSNILAAPVKSEAEREADLAKAIQVAAGAQVAVVVVGSTIHWEAENFDRPDLKLPLGQDELVRKVIAANPNTVVVVNSGGPMLADDWLEDAAAVLCVWYPGQEGAGALADVLCGVADPSGRMPITWPRQERDLPGMAEPPRTYPGVREGDGVGRKVHYSEGLLIGYRWFDSHDIEPLIPFGHGSSYADFEWSEPEVLGDFPKVDGSSNLIVRVNVANISDRPGSEVVQCYLSYVEQGKTQKERQVATREEVSQQETQQEGTQQGTQQVVRPQQWLAGFAKLHLQAGGSGVAQINLDFRSFARWSSSENSSEDGDAAGSRTSSGEGDGAGRGESAGTQKNAGSWVIDPGNYEIRLARSSRDARFVLRVSS